MTHAGESPGRGSSSQGTKVSLTGNRNGTRQKKVVKMLSQLEKGTRGEHQCVKSGG